MRGLIPFISASFWFLVRSPNRWLAPWIKLARKTPNVDYVDPSYDQQHHSRIFDDFLLGLADILIKSPNVYIAPWKKSSWKTPNVEYVDPLPWATICSIILESLMIFFSPRAVNESRPLCSEICYAHLVPVKIRNRGHTCNFQLVMHQLHSWVTRPSGPVQCCTVAA